MSQSNILIIGGGTWGCSIALELARRGHSGITVLDGSDFPSSISAGNDLNKIAEEGMHFIISIGRNTNHAPTTFSYTLVRHLQISMSRSDLRALRLKLTPSLRRAVFSTNLLLGEITHRNDFSYYLFFSTSPLLFHTSPHLIS
jgi:2-polyprenyl-6-methoxyphenol hydroxylase-like FAD-dependent oxidoreductase